ncbi:hypothetical protein KJS94_02615 [Flavihumibacter rivuli]|uniref:hypothetical protein n=1 Tax=Flavihumibacter rivuli TaxID=2838156 RepID=UPI001BDEAE7D|nr:hypothetical protein [Flavihumibacter rivuli]ULQ57089.1 hypothetical protein KJS94_02615 [Flavihumibacter rivuli]
MENLPAYIGIVLGASALLTVYYFYRASNRSIITLSILLAWLAIQAIIGLTGFYTVTNTLPPRFVLLVLPPLLLILGLFATKAGRAFLDQLDLKTLTILHIVRIPVELVLYWLFVYKTVPEVMTFEGRNWDILSGLTAPFVLYFGFNKGKGMNKTLLLAWNILCMGLLLNIVFHGVLSAPFPFQRFGFEQPNIALLHFPFIWLPGCIVPLVLLSHLTAIRQLLKGNHLNNA